METTLHQKPPHKILFSREEAASLLGICPRTLWTMAKKGRIATVKIGSRVLFSQAALDAFVRAQTSTATPEVNRQ